MNTPDLLAWYMTAFVPDPDRGYALMTPAWAASKYTRKHAPLSQELLGGVFGGATRRLSANGVWHTFPVSIAVAPETRNGLAMEAAIDIDRGGSAAIGRALDVCASYGLWAFAQLSTSDAHDGGHVRIPVAQPAPASLLRSLAERIQAAAQVEGESYPHDGADLRLPLMPHLRTPDGVPTRYPLILQTGELIDASDPWHALMALQSHWQPNSAETITAALDALPLITPDQPVRTHKSKVNPQSSASVIAWYLQNFDLYDALRNAGATGRGRVLCCPFHDDRHPSLAVWQDADGHLLCKCFSQNSNCPAAEKYWDAFNVYCHVEGVSFADGVKQLCERYNLGQRRTLKIEAAPIVEQPAEAPRTLDAHQALIAEKRIELANVIAAAQPGRVLVARATPGLGKTHAAARHAIERHQAGDTVAIVAQTVDAAYLEWQARIPGAMVWRSRLEICECYDRAWLKKIAELGYTLPKCKEGCCYKRQYTDRLNRVCIYQHNHLSLDGGEILKGTDLVIVDESPFNALIEEETASLDDLRTLGNRLTKPGRDDPAVPLLRALWKVAKDHGRQSDSLHGIALHDALCAIVGDDLASVIAAARKSPATMPLVPEQQHVELTRQFLGGLLDALDHDMRNPEGNSLLAWARIGEGIWAWAWHERHTMLSKLYGRTDAPAVLILDGSAHPLVCEHLYAPWHVDLVRIDAPLSPTVQVIQCPSTASTRKLVQHEGLLDRTARTIATVCAGLDLTLDGGVSYMAATETLAEHLGGSWLHYGGQRGRNDLANAKALAIVASPTMPPDGLYRRAMALWSDDAKAIYAGWDRQGVGDWRAIDDRLAAIADLHGPEELRQAAYRCRPVTSDAPTTLLIFSPWQLADLGLQPTQTITQVAYGNSTEAKEAYQSYQDRRKVQENDDLQNRVQETMSLRQIEKGQKIAPPIDTDQRCPPASAPSVEQKGNRFGRLIRDISADSSKRYKSILAA